MSVMTQQHAAGTFELDAFEAEKPYDEHLDTKIARVHIEKTFAGGLAGTSSTDLITVTTGDTPRAYVAIERFEGTLGGRTGGFVLQHNAGGANGEPWLTWKITEGSGTGDLAGITGEGQIIIGEDGGHSYTLDYDLG
ncbi:MAG: DUF3224 domain-containing protein [Actinoallomurus sp.]